MYKSKNQYELKGFIQLIKKKEFTDWVKESRHHKTCMYSIYKELNREMLRKKRWVNIYQH